MVSLSKIFSGNSSRFVLLIGDEGAILVFIEDGAVSRRLFAPAPDAEQMDTIIKLFETHPEAPLYVLVDMIDQSYVRHSLPPVTPLGLNKLVQRRLDRDFSKEDIKGALNLGRETEGRKDWNFLLISLAHSETLKAWLETLYDLPNHLVGIYLVPVECEYIIQQLDQAMAGEHAPLKSLAPPPQALAEESKEPEPTKKKSPSLLSKLPDLPFLPKTSGNGAEQNDKPQWQILVSHNKVGGFRQVVLRNGKLIFTRLTQSVDDVQPEVAAGNVEQEVLNTIEYLKRLSFNPKHGVDIYIIVAQDIKNAISPLRFGATNCYILTPFEAAERLKLKQAVLSADKLGDIVLATTFGMLSKHRLKLASDTIRKLNTLYLGAKGLRLAAGAVGACLLVMLISKGIAWQSEYSRNSDLELELRVKNDEFRKLQADSELLPHNVNEVTDLISAHDILATNNPTPLDPVRTISSIVNDNALIRTFSWNASNLYDRGGPKPYAGQQTEFNFLFEVVYNDENWESFQKNFDAFIENIRKQFPDYTISHDNLPGQFTAKESLKVNFEDLEAESKGPPKGEVFDIRIRFTSILKEAEKPKTPSKNRKRG